MKTRITVFLASVSCLFFLNPANAQEKASAAHQAAAEKILSLINTDDLTRQSFMAGFEPSLQQFKQMGIDAAAIEKIKQAGLRLASKIAADPDVKAGTIDLYTSTFTEKELHELAAFYQTPLGKKTLVELPNLFQKGAELGMKAAEKHQAVFQKEVMEIMQAAGPPQQ